MRTAYRCILILFLAAMLPAARGQVPPFQCTTSAGVPPKVRAEGLTEQMGDILLNCTGGAPTPAGQPLPQFNFTLFLTTNLTSAPTATNQFNEALLIVDEPASAVNPARPILNCGNAGAPDSGIEGPGACSILSTGTPASNYDGTPNGYGTAVCDGASGRPAANTYGCGRPNVYQGRLGTPSSPGQLNAVTFYNVPVDPPGTTTNRVFRITNLRANAASLGVATEFDVNSVRASIAMTGTIPVSLSSAIQTVAFVVPGLISGVYGCQPSAPSRVKVCEGFASSWKSKNISFAVGNGGVAGNAQIPSGWPYYWVYSGGANYPPDVAQNVPGAIYNTESGFQWQNNGVNAPPTPNPPFGTGTVSVSTRSSPFNSIGSGGFNTGVNTAGVAGSGTRFAIKFSGIPAGASVQVPKVVNLTNGAVSSSGPVPSGVMVLTNTDSAGAGPFNPAASGILPGNLAVYEVLWADPFSGESVEVPYTLLGAPAGTTVQASVGFAPFYSDAGSQQANASYPEPRFLDSSIECGGQGCLSVLPNQATNSGPVQITMIYHGTLNVASAQVLLRGIGVPDILGEDLSYYPAANTMTATFQLAGAAAGARDIMVTPLSGPPITLAGGFSILETPPCGYSVGPQTESFPASGGSGSLIVTPSAAQCGWSASTGASWITLSPVSANLPLLQTFTVSANTGSSSRSATITIAGQNLAVTQEGAGTCDYSISPGTTVFPVSGGSLTVNVTTQPGCAWSASSSLSWVSISGASSGAGNGAVVLQTSANSGGLLSGTVTIAGQPFLVRQSATACGATDVTSQVNATLRALLAPLSPFSSGSYTQQLMLVNTGGSVAGPVYVVLDGLCNTVGEYFCPFATATPFTSCQVPSPDGGYTQGHSPMIAVAPGGLSAGQTLFYNLSFYTPPYGPIPPAVPESSISLRVLSGTPSQ